MIAQSRFLPRCWGWNCSKGSAKEALSLERWLPPSCRAQFAKEPWRSASARGVHRFAPRRPCLSRPEEPGPRHQACLGTWIVLVHKADHGVSEAVYFHDPDSNMIEIYCDRPRSQWPRTTDGNLAMIDDPLDLDDLLAADDPENDV